MLGRLIKAWKSRDLLNRIYDEFVKMLEDCEWMFNTASSLLFEGESLKGASRELFDRDIRVNKKERKIRKQLVEHLTINPEGDVPACLLLMSVVKDAERVGDYCKNMFDVRELLGESCGGDEFVTRLKTIAGELAEMFRQTHEAFLESDREKAFAVTESKQDMARRCDEILEMLVTTDLPAKQAVCLALTSRFLKRINSHLGNIASTVIMPLHKIDYFDEDERPEGS